MPQPADVGPKPGKLPTDKMPIDHLVDVLPETSPLLDAIEPAFRASETGMTAGFHPDTWLEPYLYDGSQFVPMGDLTPNGNTFVSGIIPLNGDLYVFGASASGGTTRPLIGIWDPATRTWMPIDTSALAGEEIFYPSLLGDRIYYIVSNTYPGDALSVGFVQGSTITEFPLPVGGEPLTTEVNNGILVISGHFDNGVDVVTFDPSAAAGEQFQQYSLPDGVEVWGGIVGSVGDFNYYWGYSNGWNLYSLNVETGATAKVAENKTFLFNEWPTSSELANGTLGNDLYINVFNADGAMEILKADGATGSVTPVHVVSDNNVWGDSQLRLAEESATSLWYINDLTDRDKIVEIMADGTVRTHDTSAQAIHSAQELNGTLYVSATVGGVTGVYRLNEANASLTFVQDLDLDDTEMLVSTIDNHLIAYLDENDDDIWELWSTNDPANADSWTQISPDDVHVLPLAGGYSSMITGDFLF